MLVSLFFKFRIEKPVNCAFSFGSLHAGHSLSNGLHSLAPAKLLTAYSNFFINSDIILQHFWIFRVTN